jgi:chromosome segregation ATPase
MLLLLKYYISKTKYQNRKIMIKQSTHKRIKTFVSLLRDQGLPVTSSRLQALAITSDGQGFSAASVTAKKLAVIVAELDVEAAEEVARLAEVTRIAEQAVEIESLLMRLAQSDAMIAEQTAIIRDLNSRVDRHEGRVERQRRVIEDLGKQIAEFQEASLVISTESAELRAQNDTLDFKNEKLTADVKSLKGWVASLGVEKNRLTVKVESLEKQNKQLLDLLAKQSASARKKPTKKADSKVKKL